jgi:SpoVK/Ycf46/Vps4 family AAA+-type ATPase
LNGGKTQDKGESNGLENMPAFFEDERYKNLDPRMVELIENEIMEK